MSQKIKSQQIPKSEPKAEVKTEPKAEVKTEPETKPKAEKNILCIYQLPKNSKKNILDYAVQPSFSEFPNMPLFKYGFYYYIHQTKNKMEIFEKDSKIKDVHKIVNAFEDTVPQDDPTRQFKEDKLRPSDDINTFSIKYFKTDRIISRAFYKLWELLMMFPLIKDSTKNITTIHIAEAPGSFVQSVILYRKKFAKSEESDGDRYIGTSIEPPKKTTEYVPSFNTELNKIKQFSQWAHVDSDLTNPSIIKKFISDNAKSKGDFITADGGFNWKDENYQEQEAYVLLLSEIYCAIQTQKLGGSFVIKFFETFTELTVKMIEVLRQFYKNVLITKPLLSRPSNSERYIVCMDFQGTDGSEKLFEIIETAYNAQDKYLVNIFPDYEIPHELDMVIKLSSTQMSNEQHRQINEMITYYNDGNYYGDTYRKYLANRRKANDDWISMFYPISTSDLVAARKIINDQINKTLNTTKQQLDILANRLVSTEFNIETIKNSKSVKSVKSVGPTAKSVGPTKSADISTEDSDQTEQTEQTESAEPTAKSVAKSVKPSAKTKTTKTTKRSV